MSLDIKNFKKVHSDGETTLLKHPDGHELRIVHNRVSPKFRGQMASPKMMAEGGDPADENYYVSNKEAPFKFLPDVTEPDLSQANMDKDTERMMNPNLPSNFDQRVEGEEQRLAVNAGVPGAVMGPNTGTQPVPKEQLNQFKDRAETDVAAEHLKDKQRVEDQAQLSYEKQKSDIDAQNAIRRKSGLPLLNSPDMPQGMQQYSPESSVGIRQAGYSPQQMPQEQFNPSDYGYGQELSTYQKGAGQYLQGLQQQQQAESQAGADKSQALMQNIDAQRQMQTDFENHVKSINSERDSIIHDLQNQHINPNNFWENKSLPGKLTSAIGLILGGMGSNGGPNQALSFMEKQIDNDIMAQKLNISNKESLLNANRAKFQDEKSAVDMTRVMKNDQIAHQMELAAANATDPGAKARLNEAAGQFKMQSASIVQQMSMRGAMLKGMQNPNLDPAQKIRQMVMTGMLKPEQEQHAIKELTDVQNVQNAAGDIMNAFHAANKENTVAGRVSHLGSEPASVGVLENMLLPLIKDKEGKVNEFDFATTRKFIPKPGDGPYKVAAKEAGLKQWLTQKASHPMLHGLGIEVPILPKEYKMGAPVMVNKEQPKVNPVKQKAGQSF